MDDAGIRNDDNSWEVGYSFRKFGILDWRQRETGRLQLLNRQILFRGNHSTITISQILHVRHYRMPGDLSKNWVEVTFLKNGQKNQAYFQELRVPGWRNIVGGSNYLYQQLRPYQPKTSSRNYAYLNNTDVLIITPLEKEFEAVAHYLQQLEVLEQPQGLLYHGGIFKTPHQTLRVVVVQPDMGNTSTSMAITEAMHFFNPSLVVLTGIAGGVKDVQLGDVVVATKSYSYEFGKQLDDHFLSRPELWNYTPELLTKAKIVKREKTWASSFSSRPQVYLGAVASGNKVITGIHSELIQRIRQNFSDAIAIEMEAGGLQVLRQFPQVKTLHVRGISDLLHNKSKSDAQGYQEIAARHAAAFTFSVLSSLRL